MDSRILNLRHPADVRNAPKCTFHGGTLRTTRRSRLPSLRDALTLVTPRAGVCRPAGVGDPLSTSTHGSRRGLHSSGPPGLDLPGTRCGAPADNCPWREPRSSRVLKIQRGRGDRLGRATTPPHPTVVRTTTPIVASAWFFVWNRFFTAPPRRCSADRRPCPDPTSQDQRSARGSRWRGRPTGIRGRDRDGRRRT